MRMYFLIIIIFFVKFSFCQNIKDRNRFFHSWDSTNNSLVFKVQKYFFSVGREVNQNDTSDILHIKGYHKNFICPKDSIFYIEVYKEKFLVVSYYRMSDAMRAEGTSARLKDRVVFIDLANPKRTWSFRFRGRIFTNDIKSFNEKTGEVLISSIYKAQ